MARLGNPALGLADAYRAVDSRRARRPRRNTLGTLLYRLGRTGEAEAQFKGGRRASTRMRERLRSQPVSREAWRNARRIAAMPSTAATLKRKPCQREGTVPNDNWMPFMIPRW